MTTVSTQQNITLFYPDNSVHTVNDYYMNIIFVANNVWTLKQISKTVCPVPDKNVLATKEDLHIVLT